MYIFCDETERWRQQQQQNRIRTKKTLKWVITMKKKYEHINGEKKRRINYKYWWREKERLLQIWTVISHDCTHSRPVCMQYQNAYTHKLTKNMREWDEYLQNKNKKLEATAAAATTTPTTTTKAK